MRANRRWLLVALTLLLLGRAGRADEEYDAAKAHAAQVVAAAKDPAALRALAADEGTPDVWLVVDALLADGHKDEAKAFAAAYAGKDADALRAVAGRPLREPGDARSRLAAAEAKLAEARVEGADGRAIGDAAAELLKAPEEMNPSVVKVRWLEMRAGACRITSRLRDAARDLGAASEAAASLRWLRRAIAAGRKCGALYVEDHALREALKAFGRLAELQHEAGDVVGEAKSLADVAEIHDQFGEPRQALGTLDAAIRTLGDGGPATLRETLRARRGAALDGIGEHDAGRKALEDTIVALRGLGDAAALADACTDLGNLLRERGDLHGAKAAYVEARDAYRALPQGEGPAALDPRESGLAVVEADLAALLLEEGKYAEAFRALEAQRAVFRAADSRALAARTTQAMADVLLRRAADPETPPKDAGPLVADARALALQAEAASADEHDAEGALYARASFGQAEDALGHTDKAIEIYDQVVREATERGLASVVLEYTVALARARLKVENVGGAVQSVELGFAWLDGAFGTQGAGSRMQARTRHAELFDLGVRAALRSPTDEATRRLFRFVEIGRASTLLDALDNRDVLRARRVPADRERARADAARGVFEAKLAVDAAGDDRAALRAASALLAEAQAAYERAVDAIQAEARLGANLLYPQPITLVDAKAMLSAGQALVLYTHAGRDAYALVVTQDAAHIVPLGSAEAATRRSRETFVRGPDETATKAWKVAADQLLVPIEAKLPPAVTTVFVSPDGDLGLVPFPALRPPPSKRAFLFVPSGSTLKLLLESSARKGDGTLGVGIEKYQGPSGVDGAAVRDRNLHDLPSAEVEAAAVTQPNDVKPLLGPAATEAGLFAALAKRPTWSAVHFAIHGLVDSKNPSLSSLALRRAAPDDGDLTAFEILQHDIPTDLVVLAACDSGGGIPVPGEGLVGLVRAFLFAGCPRVVASLWNANDESAKTFSVAFHKHWAAGNDMASSIEAGRAAVRKDPRWQHPFYWAGWCGWGGR